jgi:hypothetical protein
MKKSHIRKKKLSRILDQAFLEFDFLPFFTAEEVCDRIRRIPVSLSVSGKSYYAAFLIFSCHDSVD